MFTSCIGPEYYRFRDLRFNIAVLVRRPSTYHRKVTSTRLMEGYQSDQLMLISSTQGLNSRLQGEERWS